MMDEDSLVILVTMDRVMYEIDLQSLKLEDSILATTEGFNSLYRPSCDSGYRISKNGSRVFGFYMRCPEGSETEEHLETLDVGKTRLELKMFDLSGTADHVQTRELEYAEPRSPNLHTHVIAFSPDLSIVQAGTHVFDLLAPGHQPLSFPDNPLDRPGQGEDLSIIFSSCNRYLVLIKSKDATTNEFGTYRIFRIDRAVGKVEKVAIPGLDDLVAEGYSYSATFHPELPLLVLMCFKYPEAGVRKASECIDAIEIDLEALKHMPIKVPEYTLRQHTL